MYQPRKMIFSSFKLYSGRTFITARLLFYSKQGLACTKNGPFFKYTPKQCFKNFVQSAVKARRQIDENTISSVVVETSKLLAKVSYCYES